MSTITTIRPKVKPTRRTARPASPFGAGIHPTRARFEPSDEDRAAAAAMFGVDAGWSARMAADANGDNCGACGRPVERGELEQGLCCVCMSRAEDHAMAGQYAALGMGWRSY